MDTREADRIAIVMRALHNQEVLASWRTGDHFRRTRRGEWDMLAGVLADASAELERLITPLDIDIDQP